MLGGVGCLFLVFVACCSLAAVVSYMLLTAVRGSLFVVCCLRFVFVCRWLLLDVCCLLFGCSLFG